MDGRRHPPVGLGVAGRRLTEAAHALRVCLLAAALATSLPATPVSAQDGIGLDDVVGRAAAYVAAYVDDLSNVVMEEDYRQAWRRYGERIRRRLVSELLLIRVGGDAQWVGFRDVVEVNGRRLENRGSRLASLFLDGRTSIDGESSALARARRISEESARFNMGGTHRTFNVPTYPLLFLHPANLDRFYFEPMGTDREGCGGAATARNVRFEEVSYPTMTRGFGDIDLPTRGHFCIDAGSGRVLEAEFELRHPAMGERPSADARARVSFGLEPRLNLWVPTEMRDNVVEQRGPVRVVMEGTARYRTTGSSTSSCRRTRTCRPTRTSTPGDGAGGFDGSRRWSGRPGATRSLRAALVQGPAGVDDVSGTSEPVRLFGERRPAAVKDFFA